MCAGALVIGVGLLLFAIIAFWKGTSNLGVARERTVVPLRLQAWENVRVQFETSARLPLEIWMVLQRHQGVTDERINECLAATNFAPQISWKIIRDGTVVASGDERSAPLSNYGMEKERGRLLGAFSPTARGKHELLASVASTHEDLEPAQPCIQIRPSFGAIKAASTQAAASHIVGPVLGFVGLLLLALAWRERRQIHRDLSGHQTSQSICPSQHLEKAIDPL